MEKPDIDIENFWLSFKCGINNFYRNFNISKDVIDISQKLNELQKNKKYIEIELLIHNHICHLIIDLTDKIDFILEDRCVYLYHARIILSNIKRWEKLRQKKIFFRDPIDNENMFFIISSCLKMTFKTISKELYDDIIIDFFKSCNEIIKYNNFKKIIDFAIDIDNISIIDLIRKTFNVVDYVNEKYKLSLPKRMSGKKLIKFTKVFM